MAKKNTIGGWAFFIGLVIAMIAGFLQLSAGMTGVLIILGLIVGLLNVTAKETMPFLLATVSLVIVSNFGGNVLSNIAIIGGILQGILNAIIILVIPATIVVVIKTIYALARE